MPRLRNEMKGRTAQLRALVAKRNGRNTKVTGRSEQLSELTDDIVAGKTKGTAPTTALFRSRRRADTSRRGGDATDC
jgi:hypothetical protein